MAIFNFELDIDAFIKNVEKLANWQLEQAIEEAMEEVGDFVADEARKRCPQAPPEFASNNPPLKDSIKNEVDHIDGIITARVGTRGSDYAVYVHEGTGIFAKGGGGRMTPWIFKKVVNGQVRYFKTSGQQPQPFLENAISENISVIEKRLNTEVESGIRKYLRYSKKR